MLVTSKIISYGIYLNRYINMCQQTEVSDVVSYKTIEYIILWTVDLLNVNCFNKHV